MTTLNMTAKKRPRRSECDMRTQVLEAGGHLVQFEDESKAVDRQSVLAWRTLERKGFIVLADKGCMIPHLYYTNRGEQGPARNRGHVASARFFGIITASEVDEKPTGARDERGYPTDKEVSHLCHNPFCCNPEHLIYEERWRNTKRNYCRGCDCGNATDHVACVSLYRPSKWWQDRDGIDGEIVTDPAVVKALLPVGSKILPKTHFKKADEKARNRNKRRRRSRKEAKRKEKNERREKKKEEKVGNDDLLVFMN